MVGKGANSFSTSTSTSLNSNSVYHKKTRNALYIHKRPSFAEITDKVRPCHHTKYTDALQSLWPCTILWGPITVDLGDRVWWLLIENMSRIPCDVLRYHSDLWVLICHITRVSLCVFYRYTRTLWLWLIFLLTVLLIKCYPFTNTWCHDWLSVIHWNGICYVR